MRSIYLSAFWPLMITISFWFLHYYRVEISDFRVFGVVPRTQKGLLGILSSPFIHGSWQHLISNTFPFLFLATALFMFYKPLAFKVLFWIYIGGGLWLWSFGRHANHIGASGVVYGLFAFLAISGMVKGYKPLIALSLLTIFLYGSMIWGVLPLDVKISWEGHLTGLVWGVILSFFFKHKGPVKIEHPINEDDTINEIRYGKDYWKGNTTNENETVLQNGVEDAIILDHDYKGNYYSNSTGTYHNINGNSNYNYSNEESDSSTEANSEIK